jgi:DNA-binding HxlR family transcriptional regulator
MTEDGTFAAPGHAEVTTSPPGGRGDLFDPACPTRRLLDRIGGKWTSMVIKVLQDEGAPVRFAELRRRARGISQKMLSATLKDLVTDGLVVRTVVDTVPPQVSYALTDLGTSLTGPLGVLRDWAEEHMVEVDARRSTALPSGSM